MKNYAKVLVFAAIVALVVVPAQAAGNEGLCKLITEMDRIFRILRVLAFLGAGFYIAGWAWGFIAAGEAKMDDVKKRGLGLLVGFSLLFIVGVILSFLINAASDGGSLNCADQLAKFGTK